jgi:hypothetical protein
MKVVVTWLVVDVVAVSYVLTWVVVIVAGVMPCAVNLWIAVASVSERTPRYISPVVSMAGIPTVVAIPAMAAMTGFHSRSHCCQSCHDYCEHKKAFHL